MEKIKATVELTIFNCLFPIILFEVDHKNCLKRNRDKSSAFNGVGGGNFLEMSMVFTQKMTRTSRRHRPILCCRLKVMYVISKIDTSFAKLPNAAAVTRCQYIKFKIVNCFLVDNEN